MKPVRYSEDQGERHMKISARNVLKGVVTEIIKAATASYVGMDIGGGVGSGCRS